MKPAKTFLLLLLAVALISCARPQPSPTTILLVRHAEKASDAEDSPLTDEGVRRSQALVRVVEDAGVSAIYSSQFKRNRDTAKPLSDRLGVAVTEMPVNLQNSGDYGRVLAKDILDKHAGQTVVVIGHANTIAATIEGLTGRSASLGDIQYSDLFIVTVYPTGTAKVLKAQYGL
ncbi:MAG: histidine phosphatase family protein [Pyrinomonadaceae bacterium]|nr:histidine phosphatase family protein [Pyrinomonadaceae bacterium]